MIGDLIKRFENMPTNTVADFNEVFRDRPLDYPLHHHVEIDEVVNGVRKLIINGEITFHDLSGYTFARKSQKRELGEHHFNKRIQIFQPNGIFIGEYLSVQDARFQLGINVSTFYKYLHNGKLIVKEVA